MHSVLDSASLSSQLVIVDKGLGKAYKSLPPKTAGEVKLRLRTTQRVLVR